MFLTKYGQSVAQVLAAYPPGSPGLIGAIETLIQTAEQNARMNAKDEIAATVCEGMHNGPASGLKCLSCYNAEVHFQQEMVVQAEMENLRLTKDGVPETDPDGEV